MIDPEIAAIIAERVREMREETPRLEEEDIFWSACGATLKYAEAHGHEVTPELMAAIETAVRLKMKEQP